MELYFATHNHNKLSEVKKILPSGIQLFGLDDLSLHEDIPETADTIEGNSLMKTEYVFKKHNVACFGDDTGLEVEALQGEPGVLSARYAGNEKDPDANMDLLLKKLEGCTDRKARFKTVITYFDESGMHRQFAGIINGEITTEKQGEMGFGYDPIFKPEGFDRTFAQMGAREKNEISHRGLAFRKLVAYLAGQ